MKPEELTTLIFVNWNNSRDLIDCINHMESFINRIPVILIWDNNSNEEDYNLLVIELKNFNFKEVSSFDEFKIDNKRIIFRSKKNLGFVGGNNEGIKYCLPFKTKYFWMLNTDTKINLSTYTSLVNSAEGLRAGIAGSHIYYYDEPKRLQEYGLLRINPIKGYSRNNKPINSAKEPFEVASVSGCSMMISKRVIEKIGVLDEKLFAYVEETEYCTRAKSQNVKIISVPLSQVYHKVSRSVPRNSPIRAYYESRNVLLFIKRHFRAYYLLSLIYHFIRIFMNFAIRYRSWSRFSFELKGFFHACIGKVGKAEFHD